jgi:serine/threonine protein phosphatase 1
MVLRRLFSRPAPLTEARYRLPEGERVYAIGDVHGRLDLLRQLIEQIEDDHQQRNAANITLILLGDLIDRGSDSRGVVDFALALDAGPRPCVFLMGNHEETLLRVWDGDETVTAPFLRYGGDALLQSYGLQISDAALARLSPAETIAAVRTHVPETHIEFMRQFVPMHRCGDYVFVHAGVRPGIPISGQDPIDLRWIRGDFTKSSADFGAMIVHGHSITDAPELRPNRIGIDTGAYASGRLTAVGLEGADRWILLT